MNKKTSLIFFGLLFVAVFALLLISALFKNSSSEAVNEPAGNTQGAYTKLDEDYIQYISTETRKTVPANVPEQKDEPSIERNGADELLIDVVVEEDDDKKSINFVSDTSNPFNYRDVSVSVSYCPQDSCPDGTIIPEDNNPVHNTCAERLNEACQAHQGTSTTNGGSTGGLCSDAYPTSRGCFGAAPGTPVGLNGDGECVCTITTGNICACITTKEPNTTTNNNNTDSFGNGFQEGNTTTTDGSNIVDLGQANYAYNILSGCHIDSAGKYTSYAECYKDNLKYKIQGSLCIGDLAGPYKTYQECKNALVVQQDQNSGDKCSYTDQCINNKRCTADNVKNGTGPSSSAEACGIVTVDTTQGNDNTQNNTDTGSKTPQQNSSYSGICCLQGKEVAITSTLCSANNGKEGSCQNLTQGSYCTSSSQCKTGLVCGDKKCVTSAQAFTCGSDSDCTSDKYCDVTGSHTCQSIGAPDQCNAQNPGNRCEVYGLVCHSSGQCIDPKSQAISDPNLGKRGFLCNLDGTCDDSDNDYCEREMFVCRQKPTIKESQVANTNEGQVLVDSYSQPIVQYTGQNNIPVNQQPNTSGDLQDTTVNRSSETPLHETIKITKTDINENILQTLIARLPQNDEILEQASSSGQSVATVVSNLAEVRINMCASLSNCTISQSKTITQMNGFYYTCKGLRESDQFISNLATSLNCDTDLGRFKIASAEILQQYEQDTGEVLSKPSNNYTPRVETRTCERTCYESSVDINTCIASCVASESNNDNTNQSSNSELQQLIVEGTDIACDNVTSDDTCKNADLYDSVFNPTTNLHGTCEIGSILSATKVSCSFKSNKEITKCNLNTSEDICKNLNAYDEVFDITNNRSGICVVDPNSSNNRCIHSARGAELDSKCNGESEEICLGVSAGTRLFNTRTLQFGTCTVKSYIASSDTYNCDFIDDSLKCNEQSSDEPCKSGDEGNEVLNPITNRYGRCYVLEGDNASNKCTFVQSTTNFDCNQTLSDELCRNSNANDVVNLGVDEDRYGQCLILGDNSSGEGICTLYTFGN
ncbi:hypothetical protein KC669_01685 [Candidatus Dojkabacteria bacterium]|uniref:Dickkopf N-terminal cysteine-rich domain-containing protein n=1 Tax=Candidatus Dojkabacteria bacterium TaxID=2099670 RepID=A0A955L9W8_9BACT|nr:hypothetical protein [Candidatus Dojkabacteria bacterium]